MTASTSGGRSWRSTLTGGRLTNRVSGKGIISFVVDCFDFKGDGMDISYNTLRAAEALRAQKTGTLEGLVAYVHERNRRADEPVFALTRQQVHNIVRRYGRTIGKEIHSHTLRHSFAINWVRQNQDLRRLQLLLGHRSLAVTQEYLQFRDADIMDAYNSVDFGSV